MQFPSKEQVARQRLLYPAGTRIELVQVNGTQAPPVDTRSAVIGVDDTGGTVVDWDNGPGLNIIYGVDRRREVLNE